jgi:hypothetical protein
MDAHTFHEARLRRSCVLAGAFDCARRCSSFCRLWMFANASDFLAAPFDAPMPTVIPLEQLSVGIKHTPEKKNAL